MLRRITPGQVRKGMYIHSFEGSWFKHPFWKRRFLLEDDDDVRAVIDSDVPGLMIDTDRGADIELQSCSRAVAELPVRPTLQTGQRQTLSPSKVASHVRERSDEARSEVMKVVNRSKAVMRRVFDGARLGKAIESEEVLAVVSDVTAAIERNRQAFLKVLRLKTKDEYTYLHSVAVCALMINFARRLGLDKAVIADMGTGGLLHDVGKMVVPLEILNKPERLTEEEFTLVRDHPEQGYLLLLEAVGMPELALDVCRHHHEKIDGTGYPHRLRGDEISLAARMGAICDVYDALTSNRIYKDAWTPIEAITRMREWTGQFDAKLLFTFMQSIGVFPAGIVVTLRSNRIGIVLDNGRRASRTRVLVFYSTRDHEHLAPEVIVTGDTLLHDAITDECDHRAFGISDEKIADLLQTHSENRVAA